MEKEIYYCENCKKWRGLEKKCLECGKKTIIVDVPKKRGDFYYVPGEEKPFVAVTSILSVIDKPALVFWAAKTAAEIALADPWMSVKAVASGIYRVKDKAASRGLSIHQLTEKIDKGEKVRIPMAAKGYVKAYVQFLKDISPTNILAEHTVFSRKYGYAGTLDRLVRIGKDRAILDIKTGKRIYDEVGLQLSAYKHAWNELNPKSKVNKCFVLLLKDDGKYVFGEKDAPIEVFLAFKKGWEWFNGIE